jgi:hypothetical protein
MTMDVDVIIALDPLNVDHFIAAAEELGLRPVLPAQLAELGDSDRRAAAWVGIVVTPPNLQHQPTLHQ